MSAVAVVALTVTGCSLFTKEPEVTPTVEETIDYSFPPSLVEPDAPDVYRQTVEWSKCGLFDCAEIDVPLDWADPNGETITVAVNRHRATNPDVRVGNLLINPGGPGGSGTDMLEYMVSISGERLLEAYDIIGVDPRGVGNSTPLQCGTGAEVDEFLIPDFAVTSEADMETSEEIVAAFAQRCRELSGPVVEFMDTVSAARDMDVIRSVLGDDKLHYFGYSYGTQLGATYLQLYPTKVGRVVLDGAVDLLAPAEETGLYQAAGFEKSLSNFIDWCYEQGTGCSLDRDKERALNQVGELILKARDEGFPGGRNVTVNGNLFVYGVVVTMYDERSWEYLMYGLDEVITLGSASIFYELANFYLDRSPKTGEYIGNSTIAFTAINCLDAGEGEWTLEDQLAFTAKAVEASPRLGWWFGSGTGCGGWPWTAAERVTTLDEARGAGPTLVIGTTEDPATPYVWAERLAADLDAPLLTWVGEGHTAYGRSNQCVIDAVDTFLVDGQLPADGTRC